MDQSNQVLTAETRARDANSPAAEEYRFVPIASDFDVQVIASGKVVASSLKLMEAREFCRNWNSLQQSTNTRVEVVPAAVPSAVQAPRVVLQPRRPARLAADRTAKRRQPNWPTESDRLPSVCSAYAVTLVATSEVLASGLTHGDAKAFCRRWNTEQKTSARWAVVGLDLPRAQPQLPTEARPVQRLMPQRDNQPVIPHAEPVTLPPVVLPMDSVEERALKPITVRRVRLPKVAVEPKAPSPEEIRDLTAAIRQGWDQQEERGRSRWAYSSMTVPTGSTSDELCGKVA